MATQLLQPKASPSINIAATHGYDMVFQWLFNKGNDGKISPSELCAGMAASYCAILKSKNRDADLFLTAEEAEEMVASAAADGDGLLGPEEFAALLALEDDEVALARDLEEAFSVYRDTDGSGKITPLSLQKALGMLGNERSIDDCAEMIRTFDVDGDGGVCFEEFKLMMAA